MATKTIHVDLDDTQARAKIAALHAALANIGNGLSNNAALQALIAQLNAASAAANGAASATANAGNAAGKAGGGFMSLVSSLGKVAIATVGLGLLTQGVHELASSFTDAADDAALITGRLATVTNGNKELGAAQEAVRQIAAATRSDLSATASLYADLARNADRLGATTAQVGQATKLFAMTLKVSGADANAAAGAIRQLGQAIGSGKLGGDEFASIAEADPVFMELLAKSIGVARGELKNLASEGKITGEVIKKALTDPKAIEEIEKKFGKLPVTFADIRTAAGNAMVDVAASIKKGLGIDDSMSVLIAKLNNFAKDAAPTFEKIGAAVRKAFDALAPALTAAFSVAKSLVMGLVDNIDILVPLIKAAATAWVAYKVATGAAAAVNLAQTLALQATQLAMFINLSQGGTGAMSAFRVAMTVATYGVNTFTAALAANPVTFLLVALTATIALLYQFRDAIGIGGGSVASLGDLFREVFSYVQPALESVSAAFKSFGAWVSTGLSAAFGSAWEYIKGFFSNFDFSIAGAIRFVGQASDAIASAFFGAFNVIKAVWNGFPSMFAYVVGTAVNGATSLIGGFINTTISGLNLMIDAANAVGGSFKKIGEFKAPQIKVSAPKIDIGGAYASGRVTTGSDAAERVIAGADRRGRARLKAGQGTTPTEEITRTKEKPGSSTDKDKKDKEDKAKKKLEEIQKKYDEFYTSLTEQAKVAAMLPAEAERYNKELELRKILGDGELTKARQLTEAEKLRIKTALDLKNLNEITRDIAIASNDASFTKTRLEDQARMIATSTGDTLADNLAIEEKTAAFKDKMLKAGLSLDTAAYTAALAILEARERENIALERRNRLLAQAKEDAITYAKGAVATDGAYSDRRALAKETFDKQIKNLQSVIGDVTPAQFRSGVAKATREFQDTMAEIGSDFENRMKTVGDILERVGNAIGGKAGQSIGKITNAVDAVGGFGKSQNDVSNKLQSLFGGKASPAVQSISKAVGGAVAGLEIGSQVGSAMKSLGIRGSETGAKIGGTLGGLTGNPLIAAGASVIGGLIGSLFSKPKQASAGFSVVDGQAVAGTVTGNGKQAKGTAGALATSVASGLNGIASKLGAQIGSLSGVSIGYRPGHKAGAYRVDTSGGGKLTGVAAFETEAEAIAFAIKDAIQDGALTGLSDLVNKAVKAMDIDSAIQFASDWKSLTDDLASMLDPVGAAISAVNDPLDKMRATMVAIGASTADLTKVDEYRAKKLAEIADEQLSRLNDFNKSLSGEGSGVTSLNRLTTDLAKFDGFKADIAAGKQIDQDKFTALGQEIFGLASSVYGTATSQFQDIRSMLMDSTAGAIANVQTTIDSANIVAIDRQTDAVTARQDEQTSVLDDQTQVLQEIRDAIVKGGSVYNNTGTLRAAQY